MPKTKPPAAPQGNRLLARLPPEDARCSACAVPPSPRFSNPSLDQEGGLKAGSCQCYRRINEEFVRLFG